MKSFALTTKGQVTLPVAIRRKLRLGDKGRVRFREEGDRVYVERVEDDIASAFGIVKARKSLSVEAMEAVPAQMAVARFKRATARRG